RGSCSTGRATARSLTSASPPNTLGSKAMSQENVEFVARLVDAWNQANVEAMLALFDPECEVIFPPEVPEPGPFHGHTELREWAEGFLAAWESHQAEVVELIE